MLTEQQVKIVASLHEHDEMFDTSSAVNSASTVCIYKDNKINNIPNYILNYLRPDCNENWKVQALADDKVLYKMNKVKK